jgi:soluble P-type ATPase
VIYNVPGQGELKLETIILDLNGTISVRGKLVEGVGERLAKLKELGYAVVLFTGNTRGDADGMAQSLGIEWRLTKSSEDKRDKALQLSPETCVSIGNGLIDLELMKVVKLCIVTLQAEGVHVQTMLNSDVIVPTICDALDMLIDPNILVATLRR